MKTSLQVAQGEYIWIKIFTEKKKQENIQEKENLIYEKGSQKDWSKQLK